MYFTYNGETKNITGGHNVMGANAAAATWYFAEGYTGTDFDEYLTIQNANSVAVPITITYFLATGAIVTHHLTAPPTSRTTIAGARRELRGGRARPEPSRPGSRATTGRASSSSGRCTSATSATAPAGTT